MAKAAIAASGRRTGLVLLIPAALLMSLETPLRAQDLEPRAFSAAPVGVNFAMLGYGYSTGDLLFDQALNIDDARAQINNLTGLYVRTIDFFGASSKLAILAPFVWGTWEGSLAGQDTSTTRRGFADPRIQLAVSFLGAPAQTPREFSGFREKTVAGASLMVIVPLGQYDSSKLINLGTNRWSFRPRIGVSQASGKWIFELFGDVWLFTRNPDLRGAVIEQDPIWAIQGDVIYTFRPGLWLGFNAGYGKGGQSIVNGVGKNNPQESTRLAGTLSVPVARRHSFKFVYSTGVSARFGADLDTFQVFYQYRWGAGL